MKYVRSVTTDLSDVRASIRQGLVLVNIVQLVTFVDTENALLYHITSRHLSSLVTSNE